MTDTKCEFCKSESIVIETPFVALNRNGEYEPTKSFCCTAQRKNREYATKRFSPLRGEAPSPEDISKL